MCLVSLGLVPGGLLKEGRAAELQSNPPAVLPVRSRGRRGGWAGLGTEFGVKIYNATMLEFALTIP